MRRWILLIAASSLAACATDRAPAPAARVAETNREAGVETTAAQSADVAQLQEITRILIDAGSLYEAAAEDSNNAAYAAQLRTLSQSRRAMTSVFQTRLASLGAQPAEHGQALGAAHRVLMEARTLGNEDTKVAVQEALRGENYLLEQLTAGAQNAALRADTRAFLQAQMPRVRADRDRLDAYAQTLATQG